MPSEDNKLLEYVRNSFSSAETILDDIARDSRGKPFVTRYAFLSIQKSLTDFLKGSRENRWVIMPGLRGTGKTTLLAQLYFYLREQKNVPPERILYLKADDIVGLIQGTLYEAIKAFEILNNSSIEEMEGNIYILVDEVHYDKNWALTLKSIYDKNPLVFMLATGSAAIAFHKNPDVARRARIERVFPLRFTEYETLKNGIFPIAKLAQRISAAIYLSRNAEDAYQQLKKALPEVTAYWAKIKKGDIERYLLNGSLPFTFNLPVEVAYTKVLEMINTAIYKDILCLDTFDSQTLKTFKKLILFLSVAEESPSLEKLSNHLGVSKGTLEKMMLALEQCEIIDPIPSYGSLSAKLNKPPKYAFYSPTIKAAFLWSIGKLRNDHASYGRLLEEVGALYFARARATNQLMDIGRIWGSGQADYVVTAQDAKKIIFEFCFGTKDASQVVNSFKLIKAKYGVIVSDGELKVDGNILWIPKYLFLLI